MIMETVFLSIWNQIEFHLEFHLEFYLEFHFEFYFTSRLFFQYQRIERENSLRRKNIYLNRCTTIKFVNCLQPEIMLRHFIHTRSRYKIITQRNLFWIWTFYESNLFWIKRKSDCNYTFPIDLVPKDIPLGAKSIGRV